MHSQPLERSDWSDLGRRSQIARTVLHPSHVVLTASNPAFRASYYGFSTTHDNLFAAYSIWDSIHSHHDVQHSPEYGQFVKKVRPIIGGKLQIAHLEIFSEASVLKTAIESPSTQTAVLHIAMDQGAAFLKWWKENAPKHLNSWSDTMRALWPSYTYEDP